MDPAKVVDAVSTIHGVLLMVAVTVILAVILLAHALWLPHFCDPFPPATFQVVAVHDYDEDGTVLNYDSRVLIRNLGTRNVPNRAITAAFYSDGIRIDCRLVNFHGEDDVPSHHFGIQRVQGAGCRGETWEVGTSVLIDFTDRTFMPGKTVRVDVIDLRTDCVVSSHSFRRSATPAQ